GAPLQEVRRQKLPNTPTPYMLITGRADAVFPPDNGRIEGQLDLRPLAGVVRPLGVKHIDLWVGELLQRPTPGDYKRLIPKHHRVATDDPPPVPFPLGPTAAVWIWRVVVLAVLFLVPIGLVLRQRRVALRATGADEALAWYRFWRWAHLVTLGSWLVWWTAV